MVTSCFSLYARVGLERFVTESGSLEGRTNLTKHRAPVPLELIQLVDPAKNLLSQLRENANQLSTSHQSLNEKRGGSQAFGSSPVPQLHTSKPRYSPLSQGENLALSCT